MMMPVSEFGFNGDAEFVGANPSDAAVITYYLKKRHLLGDLKLEIYDRQGTLLGTVPGGKRRGINRVEWSMRSKAPRSAPGAGLIPSLGSLMGLRVPAGTYTVKMIKGRDTFASTLTIVPEPGSRHSDADRTLQGQGAGRLYGMVERLAYLVDALADARDQAKAAWARLTDKNPLCARLASLADGFENQRVALVSSQRGEGISGEEKLREEIGTLYGNVNVYEGRPTTSQLDRIAVLDGDLAAAFAAFEASLAKDVAAVNAQLIGNKQAPIVALSQAEWDKRRPGG